MPKTIAIATCADFPQLTDDERPLVAALGRLGVAATPVVWDSTVFDFAACDAVLVRSTWDYHLRLPAFLAWLDRLESMGVPMWNPVSLVRWNLDKSYLRDLAARGVVTVPTVWLTRESVTGGEQAVARILDEPWTDIILKPAISAAAHRTVRVGRDALRGQSTFIGETLLHSAVLAQPFFPEIVSEGEYSLLFIAGRFSHAVLKQPATGDFRVQLQHGGTQRPIVPAPSLRAQAEAVIAAIPMPWLYARVDGVLRNGTLHLMELELIEPYLYFGSEPAGVERLASTLRDALDGDHR